MSKNVTTSETLKSSLVDFKDDSATFQSANGGIGYAK
jgi:hypothetical protein